ncbi:MAG: phosphoenolpyruvate--protein phosphotransferase [Solirubrobacterales bacterium]|nr:phosphoenolpyruvate--protein phosphotransferase [Solirubrobacterales bacterium]
MGERMLRGAPAAPGLAVGRAWSREVASHESRLVASDGREREHARALAALAQAAEDLDALAAGLSEEQAEIVRTGALMAADPALSAAVTVAALEDGLPASDSILRATEAHAEEIAAIADETLAARADDIRSLGRRAARLAAPGASEGGEAPPQSPPPPSAILIAADLGPADVAELAGSLVGIALIGGGATAHAAILARSLGMPMVTGLGPDVLDVPAGALLLLDGDDGSLVVEPTAERARAATGAMQTRERERERDAADGARPAVTRDGRRVTVLANVASVAELEVGLRSGAEGIGLLRTELAFLDAAEWPTEAQHLEVLEPILQALGARPAMVRMLDFGADKCPPFLSGTDQRGLALLVSHEGAFVDQLRATLRCSRDRDVRLLLPMVDHPDELAAAQRLIEHTARALGVERLPAVGAMIETPAAVGAVRTLAAAADFLSIGTNDLTAEALGVDRFSVNDARAHDPAVLRLIALSVNAAHEAGIALEVCGEAASDPVMLPLLVGLDVDELSVGSARVADVRRWIRRLGLGEVSELAAIALEMAGADEVEAALAPLARRLQSGEGSDAVAEGVDRGGRILALGP